MKLICYTEELNKLDRRKVLYKETNYFLGFCMKLVVECEALGLRINDFSQPNPNEEIGAVTIRKHVLLYHKSHSIKTHERDIPVSMDLIYAMDDYLCNYCP